MATPSEVIASFPSLGDVLRQGQEKDAAFLILLITHFDVIVSPKGGRTLKLGLSLDLPALRTTREKQLFQQACAPDEAATEFVAGLKEPGLHRYAGPFPFRWASGGYLPIFVIGGVRYCMLFLRDLAPVAGWNVANGASASPVELWHVEMMVEREPKEEILVINRAGPSEFCYRLESPGGSIQTVDHHETVLEKLGKNIPIEMEPLVGRMVTDAPDRIEVSSATWAVKHCPHVTPNGFVILNPENGENGIEFIQVVEWEIPERLIDLAFFDAEVLEKSEAAEGAAAGALIQQAVGLFPFNELIHEFQKPEPRPIPKHVFERGQLLSGDVLEEWLQDQPHAGKWCPVARKTLHRYISHAFGACNRMVRTSADTWIITFDGKSVPYKHLEGFSYIAHLLRQPGQPISCAILSSLTHPSPPDSSLHDGPATQSAFEENLSVGESAPPQKLLDDQARLEITKHAKALRDEVKECQDDMAQATAPDDAARLAELEEILSRKEADLAAIIRQLQSDCRADGTSRAYSNSPDERRRNAVCKCIGRSLGVIKEKDESLWRHLNGSIDTGRDCIYSPPPGTTWSF